MKQNILILNLMLLGIASGFSQEAQWFKGNLHTHSYWSDGDEFPEMIMDWYKSHGYNFVALSDHNIIAEGVKWKTIPKAPVYREGFQEYLETYGEDWVNYRKDANGIHVKLKTLEEFRRLFEEPGEFMIFKAQEVTSYLGDKAVHMGAINVQELVEPQEGSTIVELIQNNIDAIAAQSERTGKPILQHLNHPNFTYAITAEDMIALDGERFFEVFNGHPYVNNYGDSIHSSTEEMWDQVNIAYIRTGKPLLYGLATDDSHNYHKFGSKYSNAGRGWVMVKSKELSPRAIIENLEAGNFYSTTGVIFEDVSFEDNLLSIDIKEEEEVSYRTEIVAVEENGSGSKVIEVISGTDVEFRLPEGYLFMRAKVISDKPKKNPYHKGDLEVAWTQPYLPRKGK